MKKVILIAPLNWGLGHATRCFPIIRALLEYGFEPLIASDGEALKLLNKEFPQLFSVELPSYNITYARNAKYFKWQIIKNLPKILKIINAENNLVKEIIEKHGVSGIISDNRLGVYSKKIPSVFITHQLKVISGNTTWLSTKIHEKFINNFDECWVPDFNKEINLGGILSNSNTLGIPIKHMGPLSRFKKENTLLTNDLLIILSGPEPHRSLLEHKIFIELKKYSGKVIFVKGIVEKNQTREVIKNVTIYNFMITNLLEKSINKSKLIISRSGYTTIMDLAKLNKKAFFIPTPGQFEQEYLANRLTKMKMIPSCKQDDFSIEKLETVNNFSGFKPFNFETDFKSLFDFFERE